MKTKLRPLVLMMALSVMTPLALAQPVEDTRSATAPATKSFSQQELDRLLAPIALYPDALLAQILMASTYPLEVVQAARWSKENPKLSGKALEDAVLDQPWDPSVKSLTSVPQVLQQMSDKLDWTQKVGDAFLAQKSDVMSTVQGLRAKAAAAGNLKSGEQQVVKTEVVESKTVYVVESPKPGVIYVPTYNPSVVYGSWPYSAPPYYMYPPSYVYPPGLSFATGVLVGAAIWGIFDWRRNDIDININRYNSFNRTNITSNNWSHNVDHRRGVAYRDANVAQQYNRGNVRDSRSGDAYRGRTDSARTATRAQERNVDNAALKDRAADRSSSNDRAGRDVARESREQRDAGGRREAAATRDRAADSDRTSARERTDRGRTERVDREGRGSAFSGAGQAASTRESSRRGSESRAAAGGGGARPAAGGGRAGGGDHAGGGRAGGGRRH